ncbi:hypothetical protein Nepgr_021747 [Nepenthes gracilis]|uniref:DUF4378 domain-containing protein n=1 Tax=Nepenthes gracilis TaxID=150966 RepID=A0AAD3XXP3_NEPGR|nr:hypothetical protein Nepgr_021747 [Nepenthes gracilis]
MGADKPGSKGVRYVGGLLQLFDWNSKSRKKLFSSKYELPGQKKQGKTNEGNLPATRICLVDEEEIRVESSIKGGSDYSCASSVTDDEGYGIRAPGVVARLMGLDSLPTSNVVGPYSTHFFDTRSLQDAPFRKADPDLYHDYHILQSGNQLEPKPQKTLIRPIEKFQTEVLPPKSAKSIPITHHKLLSPIKSPGFIPSQDVAHIMEAAAKIIEPGPQAITRTKISSMGSSSVPLKVQELKVKLETAQRPCRTAEACQRLVETNAVKCVKERSLNKSWNGTDDTMPSKIASTTDDSSASLKNKGKSISLAIQAKVNVQKREGLNPSDGTLEGLKDHDEVQPSQSFKNQTLSQKITHRRSSGQIASAVLRQNNDKQNCSTDKDKLSSKSFLPNLHGRKTACGSSSFGRQRSSSREAGLSRVGLRRSSIEVRDGDKEVSYSGVRNIPRKKRSIDRNSHLDKSQVGNNMLIRKHDKQGESNTEADGRFNWVEDSGKKGMDVVSFTFTTPLTRSMPASEPSKLVDEKSNSSFSDNRNKNMFLSSDGVKFSSLGYSVTGADALSILLEQKLKELTNGHEASHYNFSKPGASFAQQNVVPVSAENALQRLRDKKAQLELNTSNMCSQIYSFLSATEPEEPRRKYKFQGREEMDEYSSNNVEISRVDEYCLPSPVSILEPSLLAESCNSSGSAGSNSAQENKQCSSVEAQEVAGLKSMRKFSPVESEPDLSDSASSTYASSSNVVAKGLATGTLKNRCSMSSTDWELDYIKDILCNVELMFKDYASGRTSEIINPHLFDQLERRRKPCRQAGEDEFRCLERKVIFDCVSECLDLRCQRLVGGGYKMWMKGLAMVRSKGRLAEQVYHREVWGWRSMGNCMVDELVDKDMSSQYGGGRWLDFEVDEFALGVEVEMQIFNCLIDDLVSDIFPCSSPYFCAPASAM